MSRALVWFRIVAWAEALSYLVLLGWAMPMKYLYHQHLPVRITGSIHGGLFILFVLTLAWAARVCKWPWFRAAEAFVASLIPFGPLFLEYKYRDEFAGAPRPDADRISG